jgi:polyketide biosynthesis acyl carrier protein
MTRSTAPSRADILAAVTASVTEILPTVPAEQVTGDKHLKDLGADSVDRVEIIMSVLDRLGISEPLSSFSDLPDLDAMVDLLTDQCGGTR